MLHGPRPAEHASAALRDSLHRLPLPTPQIQSNGFTSVNSGSPSLPSFQHSESSRPWRSPPGRGSPGENITVSTAVQTPGWRPDIREVTSTNGDGSDTQSKRKLADLGGVNTADVAGGDAADTPNKRRQLPNLLDSAIDLTSPDTDVSRRPPQQAVSSRVPSPVRERGQGPPPPQASSQTVASLAESAKKFNEAYREATQPPPAKVEKPRSPSPADEDYDEDDANGPGQDNDEAGQKNRKRNFANRTKTGCHTCRQRKKKCDERKPTCLNCEKGQWVCHGYGARPPGLKVQTTSRQGMPALQPSVKRYSDPTPSQYPPANSGPTSYWSVAIDAGSSYTHWGAQMRTDEPNAPRAQRADSWAQQSWSNEPPPHQAPLQQQRQPPLPPPQPQRQQSDHSDRAWPPDVLPPPVSFYNMAVPHSALPPPLPQPADPYTPHQGYHPYGPQPGIHPTAMSHSSGSSSNSGGRYGYPQQLSEKEKMLRGLPFMHYTDPGLLRERERCTQALILYNEGANPDRNVSIDQRGQWFSQVLEPRKRPQNDQKDYHGPHGEIGDLSIVDTPFRCDYGYHIHLGKEVVISAECYLQDGGGIFIGDRVVIGHRTQLLTLTASVEAKKRGGSQGKTKAGTIWIGDDVFIGAGAIVLPYVTIGKGAVVGAGSVVSRDVPEYTVVAGNPAKHVRRIEANADHHCNPTLDLQEEKAVKAMVDYANCGYKQRSPRLI